MHWYDKLSRYFPVEEMKSQRHMEVLLRDKPRNYIKDEGPDHVMMYVEFDDFVFVDYVFVDGSARSRGIGRDLMKRLKEKGKPILLEVEPLDYEDSDTEKRLRFYVREGFRNATRVAYRRPSLATGQKHPLEILYWTPGRDTDEVVYEAMCRVYADIHCYRDAEIYGEAYDAVADVLSLAAS
jgi:ribosomal protein S18 acetylase RimI-like enzyme